MKWHELRQKSEDELREELEGLRRELFNLRFQRETEQLDNTAQFTNNRKRIARILTVLRERELAAKKDEASK